MRATEPGATHGNTIRNTAEVRLIRIAQLQIGQALHQVYGLTGTQTAQVLKSVGFPATDVANALRDVFNQTAQAAAGTLQAVGFLPTEIPQPFPERGALARLRPDRRNDRDPLGV